ncbi:MAG: hypothetical protein ACTSPV_16335 [Candidatus Hodarchaeales archaeon]
MTILKDPGDEVQGERIICIYRKRSSEFLIPLTAGHRAIKTVIKGMPARVIVDKLWRFEI